MAATSDTLALAAEERAKQGIHELEISFGGELDLYKHSNNCDKNPGHRKFFPINKLTKYQNYSKNILAWIRHVSRYTVKLCVNYISPNRPPGYPLSGRAGQRVLSVGSGYVAEIPPSGNDKMPCPFTNCGELPLNHEVRGYFTVVTAAHVVFDDEEAKNTTVEFFYDDPSHRSGVMTASGVKVAAFSVDGDFCELLCVTHDASLAERLNERVVDNKEAHNAALEFFIRDMMRVSIAPTDFNVRLRVTHDPNKWEMAEPSGRRICDLFRNLLPGIENITCTPGICFEFIVEIRLGNPSEALQTLALLHLFTLEDVHNLFNMSMFGYDTSHDLLKSTSFKIADILHLITKELCTARFIDGDRQSTSFLHLREKLMDLHGTLSKPDAENLRNHWHDFLSIISELVKFYCTVEKLGERFSFLDCHPSILNRYNAVNISNDTATVRVTILRERERSFDFLFLCDYDELKSQLKPNDMLLVHIAHPHGQSKQVTIGRQTDCFTGEGFYHQLYTAPTCPGCSGGPVWMIPVSGDLSQIYGVPHSGHIGNELNRGCSWTVYPHQFEL